MEGPHDKRSGDRTPIGLSVRLSYGTVDEFVDKFAVDISRGGIFIRTRDPKPVGTMLNLELRLTGGEAVVRARGVVRWVADEDHSTHPPTPSGMGVQFLALDESSKRLVDRIVTLREQPIESLFQFTSDLLDGRIGGILGRIPRASL